MATSPKSGLPARGDDRFNMHFTPTSASWMNMVERFCGAAPVISGEIHAFDSTSPSGLRALIPPGSNIQFGNAIQNTQLVVVSGSREDTLSGYLQLGSK
jgi:hypothetical protein